MTTYKILTIVGGENNKKVALTSHEQTFRDAEEKAWTDNSANRKLEIIRMERNQKLKDTDWLVTSGKISDAEKTWRENLRKIPQDYTTESQYDTLLAEDENTKELTNAIWSKP